MAMAPMDRLLAALRSLSLTPEMAAAERIAPLLYFGGPETASPALRKAYYDSAARNLLLFEALDEILRAFGSLGLRPVLLKGADFARRLYPDPALRPMSDLDLWVAPDEVNAAERCPSNPGLSFLGSRHVARALTGHSPRAAFRRRRKKRDRRRLALVARDARRLPHRSLPRLVSLAGRRCEARCHGEPSLPRGAHEAPAP